MGLMTAPIETPCQTGQLCRVPKWRDQILQDPDLDDERRAAGVAWVESLCDHETHPDDWYEDPGAGYGTPPFWRTQRARARCFNDCPIRIQCLGRGMEAENMAHGIWGGYTVVQRAQIESVWALRKENNDAEKEQEAQSPPNQQGDTPRDSLPRR